MEIRDVDDKHEIVREIAEVLIAGFRTTGIEPWKDLEAAIEEVRASLTVDRISRAAFAENGEVLGWIGGIEEYEGFVWELHPLVVRPDIQRKGIGRALVADFETRVKMRGGTTIRLGTDDENNRTSLGGIDLYPNLLENLLNVKNLGGHPFEFYQKLGYVITGVIPDANGFGKPDILMCKRV
jgi:aminoglycoside 6'-N-acetyltransferase I